MTSIPSMPSYFLRGATITDLNRQTAWESLSEAVRSDILANPPDSTSTTTGTSSGAGGGTTSSGSTSYTGSFVSRGSGTTNTLPYSAFEGRLDMFSAIPTAETLRQFAQIWATATDVSDQLDPAVGSRGALFVNLTSGTVASGDRMENPFGLFAADGTFQSKPYGEGNGTLDQYFAFEDAIKAQEKEVLSAFGGTQGLLGYDQNGNGRIDDESELFGFIGGLSLDGLTSDTNEPYLIDRNSDSTPELNWDVNYSAAGTTDRTKYNGFMILTGDGNSVSLNQYNLDYNAAINSYTSAQTLLRLSAGGSTVSVRSNEGFTAALI